MNDSAVIERPPEHEGRKGSNTEGNQEKHFQVPGKAL